MLCCRILGRQKKSVIKISLMEAAKSSRAGKRLRDVVIEPLWMDGPIFGSMFAASTKGTVPRCQRPSIPCGAGMPTLSCAMRTCAMSRWSMATPYLNPSWAIFSPMVYMGCYKEKHFATCTHASRFEMGSSWFDIITVSSADGSAVAGLCRSCSPPTSSVS